VFDGIRHSVSRFWEDDPWRRRRQKVELFPPLAIPPWLVTARCTPSERAPNPGTGTPCLADGRLLIALCRQHFTPEQEFQIHVYESRDEGLTWEEVAKPGIQGKEPSLTALPDGAILMTAQNIDFSREKTDRPMIYARSEDDGRTWEVSHLPGMRYPRNVIVAEDGSLLFLRSTDDSNRMLQLCRSRDSGRTWDCRELALRWADGRVHSFSEVSVIDLDSGTLLAALRHSGPERVNEGFQNTMLIRSDDDGRTWSEPVVMLGTAKVHAYFTKLSGGRVLVTHSNYHLPFGVCAVTSDDGGKTWDLDHPVQLSLSADHFLGWPVTLELPDGSLVTSYAGTTYSKQPPDRFTCEVVRWRLPDQAVRS